MRTMSRPSSNLRPDLDGATWRKTRRSQGSTGNCVEVTRASGILAIRDSKNPHGPALVLTLTAARQAAATIKHGAYDI
jgi:Domain of unknown function (DUF397)